MAETFDMPFFEISCKNDVNVDASFLTLARMIKERTSQNVSSVLILFVCLNRTLCLILNADL